MPNWKKNAKKCQTSKLPVLNFLPSFIKMPNLAYIEMPFDDPSCVDAKQHEVTVCIH